MDPGNVVWFEIGTGDAAATEEFYGRAFGWRFAADDTAGGPDANPDGLVRTRSLDPSGNLFGVFSAPAR
ncbi:hypothetical protein ACIBKY_08970 [Nonomuraea sp. NPDC050394]|uniref:hypothetical protein n=1 Tax=Nonomuraea sp. NPDC050394 TaxID=3364363 RepID=UPI0037935513